MQRYLTLGQRRVKNPGGLIYSQGERSRGLLYLRSGLVRITMYSEDGREKVIGFQQGPTMFGEMAAFDERPHSCTAVALSECDVYLFTRDAIWELVQADPQVAFYIMKGMARKLRVLVADVEGLSFLGAPSRIASLLGKLLAEHGEPCDSGEKLSIALSHQELANVARTSRVTVTLFLSALEKEGTILRKGKTIYVRNTRRLLELSRHPFPSEACQVVRELKPLDGLSKGSS